jgi:hypothetical protein
MIRRALVALVAAMLTIAAVPAHAQNAPETGTQKAQKAQKKKPAPRQVLRLEELKVEGRIQKPEAMFVMPRATLGTGDLDRSEPLLPKIVQAANEDPF